MSGPEPEGLFKDLPAEQRPIWRIRLRAEPGIDPIRALRWGLKYLLRQHGLRCVSVEQENPPDKP